MRDAVPRCHEANTLHQLVPVEEKELSVTPIIQPFCSNCEMHERGPIVLGVCEKYDTVED